MCLYVNIYSYHQSLIIMIYDTREIQKNFSAVIMNQNKNIFTTIRIHTTIAP